MKTALKTKKKQPTQAQLRRAFEKATKLSQILAIALHDLKKVERNKKFVVDMGTWYYPTETKTCEVCLAGAVMVGRYGKFVEAWGVGVSPEKFSKHDDATHKFYALDSLRCGYLAAALSHMGVNPKEYVGDGVEPIRTVAEYHDDKNQWWADMRKLLADLKKAGL